MPVIDTYKFLLANSQDGGVCFEIYTLAFLDCLETFDCDVAFVRKTQANNVQHCSIT